MRLKRSLKYKKSSWSKTKSWQKTRCNSFAYSHKENTRENQTIKLDQRIVSLLLGNWMVSSTFPFFVAQSHVSFFFFQSPQSFVLSFSSMKMADHVALYIINEKEKKHVLQWFLVRWQLVSFLLQWDGWCIFFVVCGFKSVRKTFDDQDIKHGFGWFRARTKPVFP